MFRMVIHGIPTRQAARKLGDLIDRTIDLSDYIGPAGTITIEPDDAETANRPGGAATEWLSLRKDTPAMDDPLAVYKVQDPR